MPPKEIIGDSMTRIETAGFPGRRSHPPFEVRIDSLAFGGEGIARRDGKVCFVPGALPGERAEVVPASTRRSYDRMRLLRILEPAPERRLPLCPHTDVCGGCSLQCLSYEAQLAAKADQVRNSLDRLARITVPEAGPPLPSPLLVGYRNKMEFTFAPRPWLAGGPPEVPLEGPALGLHVPGRFDAVFDLESCALASGNARRAVEIVRAFARARGLAAWRSDTDAGLLRHLLIREGRNTGELLIGLVVRALDPALQELAPLLAAQIPSLVGMVLLLNTRLATVARGEEEIVVFGRPWLRETLSGRTFQLQVQSFFQTNTWGAEALVAALRRMVAGSPRAKLLDLYCGAGTLGILLADLFDVVVGIESVPSAVADARRNAALNGVENARFVEGLAEDWLRGSDPDHEAPVVVVDPPRAGLHPRALRGLIDLAPERIVYVSCHPATLARDAAVLCDEGYLPRQLQIVDLFPHTAHVESILLLER